MSRYPPPPGQSSSSNAYNNHHPQPSHQDSLPYDQDYNNHYPDQSFNHSNNHNHQPYYPDQAQDQYYNQNYGNEFSPDNQYPPSSTVYGHPHDPHHHQYIDSQNSNYPPGFDPGLGHHGPKGLDEYYSEYDQTPPHHQVGGAYDYDEKKLHHQNLYPPSPNPVGLDPPSFGNTALNTPTRGSVAAQMAAEGAIPEKAGLRLWRSDEHSGAFTRGGKGKSCGRCCCCTTIVIVLVIVGVIAGFLLWFRPPNATFNGIAPPTAGNQVDLQPGGFLLNFDLKVGVMNPNFFGASFSQISAKAFYPLNKTSPLGGGELDNVEIKPHSNTTINFPFQINYTSSLDPNRAILADIANKCGFLGATKAPIRISFDVTIKLKVLAITVSPTFSSSSTFTCPLKQSDFQTVLGGNQNLDALSSMLTGSGGAPAAGGGGAAAAAGSPARQRKSKRSEDEY